MLYDNFAMLTKRELLIRIVKLLKEKNLVDGVKYIPVEMRPRSKNPIHRPFPFFLTTKQMNGRERQTRTLKAESSSTRIR